MSKQKDVAGVLFMQKTIVVPKGMPVSEQNVSIEANNAEVGREDDLKLFQRENCMCDVVERELNLHSQMKVRCGDETA